MIIYERLFIATYVAFITASVTHLPKVDSKLVTVDMF